MKISIYSENGTKKKEINLSKDIFGQPVNPILMAQLIALIQSNRRNNIASVKTRGMVSATTKKMFRQKGTGNARRGSNDTNILRGGGATKGATGKENFTKSMPKKQRRAALFSALSAKASSGDIFGLDGWSATTPKTKKIANFLSKAPQGKKYLFVIPEKDKVFTQSIKNIPSASYVLASYLNPYNIMKSEKICFVSSALESLDSLFTSQS